MGDKFEEHMCPPKSVELVRLNGEKDTFTFQPLGFEYMPKFFKLMKKMYKVAGDSKGIKDISDISDEQAGKFMESMDEESLTIITDLINGMVKESYPEEFKTKEGQKKMSRFMAHNMMDLMSVVIQMNSPSGSEDANKKDVTFGAQDGLNAKSNKS